MIPPQAMKGMAYDTPVSRCCRSFFTASSMALPRQKPEAEAYRFRRLGGERHERGLGFGNSAGKEIRVVLRLFYGEPAPMISMHALIIAGIKFLEFIFAAGLIG